jgi:hypothetical protein
MNKLDKGIHTIILPYLSPIQRLVIALTDLGQPAYYYQFLADPAGFIIQHNRKKKNYQIIFIHQDDEKNKGDSAPNKGFDSEFRIDGLDDYGSSGNLGDIDEWPSNKNVIHKTTKGKATANACWEFLFYRREIDKGTLSKFNTSVSQILKSNNLVFDVIKMIEVKEIRKLLKEAYTHLANRLDKNINNTSLVVYHAPIKNHHGFCINGQLLTGDIDLSDKNETTKLVNHFTKQKTDNIFMLQIPHHGSIHNWNCKLTDMFYNTCLFVASGQHEKWKHPHPLIECEIQRADKLFCDCNKVKPSCTYHYYTNNRKLICGFADLVNQQKIVKGNDAKSMAKCFNL